MKGFNILILLVMLTSLFPYGIDASYNNNNVNVQVEAIQENGGYFSKKTDEVQVNQFEYKDSIQEVPAIKTHIESYPLNTPIKTGDSVVVTTLDGDIIATPHTLLASGWVTVNYRSKSFSGPVEISFGFNGVDQVQMAKGESYESYEHTLYNEVEVTRTAVYKPSKVISKKSKIGGDGLNNKYDELVVEEVEDGKTVQKTLNLAYDSTDGKSFTYKYKDIEKQPYKSTYVDWKPSAQIKKEYKSLQGANKWDSIEQSPIIQDTWYSARFWVEIPFKGKTEVSGKYNIAIKPVGADLSSAVILDPWYNASWLYRKSITVTNASANYQTKIIVGYNSTAVGEDVDCNSHCNTTFDDLRFTGADEVTLLDYWIEFTNTTAPYYATTVWVENNAVPDTTLYMYYGNAGATTTSNGTTTFIVFDDFERGNDGDTIGGAWTETAAHVHISTEQDIGNVAGYFGTRSTKLVGAAAAPSAYINQTAGTDYAIRFNYYKETATTFDKVYHGDGTNIAALNVGDVNEDTQVFDGATWVDTTLNCKADTWGVAEANNFNWVGLTMTVVMDGVTKTGMDISYTVASYANQIVLIGVAVAGQDSWVDNFIVRKWAATEQTFSSYGDELTDVPEVTTIAATLVEEETTTVGGNITYSSANVSKWGIQYGNAPAYGLWDNTSSNPGVPYLYSINLSSLIKGELYYFRAFAENTNGFGPGAQMTFLTKPDPPTGLTLTAVNTTSIRAVWTVGTGADITYLRYSNVSCPLTVAGGTWGANVTAPTATVDISGLNSLQTYYVSVWSVSTGGGLEQHSDTYLCDSQLVPGLPTVTTNAPTGYGNDWVSVSGNQTGGYPVSTLFGFQYGPTVAYGSWSNTTITVSGGMFSATISGLIPSSSYHYRAFAQNVYGIGYGADLTFSTAGTAILYENHLYGCNTTWSQVYESTSANITSNYTATQVFGNNWTAQTFTTTQSHSVHQVVLWASRSATAAAGYVYVSIREATTDNVTTPDLAIGLYAISYVSTTGGPIEVSLENEIQLDTTKKYAIVVRAPSADSTNYISLWSSNTSGTSIYAGGNAIRSVNGGGTWASYTGYDLFFSIIGRPQPIYGNVEAAQSFTVGASPHTAYKVRLILGRIGQPGNVYVSIRNYIGGVISNADLAVVALNGNAITLDKASYDCVLVPEKSLEAGKQYVIVVTAPSGDRYNYILMCADAGAGYALGTALMSIDSGITWTVQAFDYNFEVWGNACLNVLNAKVFKNYLVTGDWLITAETLNVSPPYYDSNQDPSTLFILSFMSLTGTTYASTPCELWEKGPIVIYLNPTQASALTWGGNYKVRLGDLAGTVYSEYGLLSTDWSASSLIYLDNWVRLVAKDMEAYQTARTGATVTYLTYVADKGYVLNQDGGAIFNQACPRLSYVRPNIFQVTSNQPDITTTTVATPGASGPDDFRVVLGSYLSGLLDQGAAATGIGDTKTFGGFLMVAIYFLIAFGTVVKGFAWAGMIAAFPVVLIGIQYKLLDIQMLLVILVILVFLFVREFFWKGG